MDETQRGRIAQLRAQRLSPKEIARTLKLSPAAVSEVIRGLAVQAIATESTQSVAAAGGAGFGVGIAGSLNAQSALDAPKARARNPYARSWLWIPGSHASHAPRND